MVRRWARAIQASSVFGVAMRTSCKAASTPMRDCAKTFAPCDNDPSFTARARRASSAERDMPSRSRAYWVSVA